MLLLLRIVGDRGAGVDCAIHQASSTGSQLDGEDRNGRLVKLFYDLHIAMDPPQNRQTKAVTASQTARKSCCLILPFAVDLENTVHTLLKI